ncbi:hypothetical protein ACFQGE_10200 [Halomicroarcula sp. GCM10025817]|uniref:hypothetical protein n=1 Tax=Haloarcula TaxID=2237 RepID=UPI0023E8B980|nr:hypothetical protein [Halomicroarcula sp. SYNS111]
MSEWYRTLKDSGFNYIATVESEEKIYNYLLATEIDLFYLEDIWVSVLEGKAKLMFEHDAETVLNRAEKVEIHKPEYIVNEVIKNGTNLNYCVYSSSNLLRDEMVSHPRAEDRLLFLV